MAITRGESISQGYLGLLNPITGATYDAVQTLVTCDASQDKIVTHLIAFNFHSSAVTLNIYYLPNTGGAVRTPGSEDSYKLWEISIAANDTEIMDVPLSLNATNDSIRVYASVASKINIMAFGYEVA